MSRDKVDFAFKPNRRTSILHIPAWKRQRLEATPIDLSDEANWHGPAEEALGRIKQRLENAAGGGRLDVVRMLEIVAEAEEKLG